MDLILCTAVDLASLRCGAGGSARVAGKASSSNSGRTMLNSGIAAGSMTMAGVGQTASVSAERALDAWERDGGRATRVAHRAQSIASASQMILLAVTRAQQRTAARKDMKVCGERSEKRRGCRRCVSSAQRTRDGSIAHGLYTGRAAPRDKNDMRQ